MGGRKDIAGQWGTSFRAKRWLSLDLCGMLGISLSWGVHLYALVVIATQLISNSFISTLIYVVLYLPTAALAMTSLYMAWTTDPGAVPLGARPLVTMRRASSASLGGRSGSNVSDAAEAQRSSQRAIRRCHKCHDNYKPPRAHHDSVTGRCIVKFDHYCPWVNNAVGALNHKFFCLFLLYTAGTCLISLLLLLVRAVHCGYLADAEEDDLRSSMNVGSSSSTGTVPNVHHASENSGLRFLRGLADGVSSSASTNVAAAVPASSPYLYRECDHFYDSHLVLGLFVASLVFLVFTCSMGCEQFEAIESGQGKIARMKIRVGQAGTEFARVTEEFNEMFGGRTGPKPALHWFVPTPVQFPGSTQKVILGYEWDDTLPAVPYQESDGVSLSSSGSMDNGNGAAAATAAPSDVEMQELESGRRKKRNSDAGLVVPPAGVTNGTTTNRPAAIITRQSSDLSRAESQSSSARNRRVNSRVSDDSTTPHIV